MARFRDCIFCGEPNGSREHTFPAALGGRRMNKGILCGPHNEQFSILDAEIARQLAGINGLLGVRGDHLDEPRLASCTSQETGESYDIDRTGQPLHPSPRVVSENVDGSAVHQVIVASSEGQVQEHFAEMRERGLKADRVTRRATTRFLTTPLNLVWDFGGELAFRAAARIALNFLAHYFPAVARDPGLAAFKAFVLGSGGSTWAAHSFRWPTEIPASAEPEPFSHRVLIGVDSQSGRAFGRVSFFGTFAVAVNFGTLVERFPSRTVVVDIRPLIEAAPADIVEQSFEEAIGTVTTEEIERPENVEPEVRGRMSGLVRAIEMRQRRAMAAELASSLNDVRGLGDAERVERVEAILASRRQIFLNLMKAAVDGLAGSIRNIEASDAAIRQLHHLVAGDPTTESGLTATALATLNRVWLAVSEQVSVELAVAPVTPTTLAALLWDRHGVSLASLELLSVGGPELKAVGPDLRRLRLSFAADRHAWLAKLATNEANAEV